MAVRGRVLVVDDERAVRMALNVNLTKHGLLVTLAENPEQAKEHLKHSEFDVMLTDVRMPGGTGIELLSHVRAAYPELEVIIMTGYGSVTDAVDAMKVGAFDYIIKPIEKNELLVVLDKALNSGALRAEVRELRRQVGEKFGFEKLIGITPVMRKLYEDIAAIAESDATVLIQGPTGTGKELLSQALHHRSRRSGAPFVRVNCGAIPATLIESELFGHERGSFTGAIRQHIGKFEQADGGTLLLDEIGEIDQQMQVKLLRILENGEFSRVGGSTVQTVDVRVIAATNRDLRREVQEGRFREDLFYRLNVLHLRVPPLRDRRDDIPLLADFFLKKYSKKEGINRPSISQAALHQLMTHSWPGNVRELEHAIERALILSSSDTIESFSLQEDSQEGSFPEKPALPTGPQPLRASLTKLERTLIIQALVDAKGIQAKAARALEISKSNLNYRMKKLGITMDHIQYS